MCKEAVSEEGESVGGKAAGRFCGLEEEIQVIGDDFYGGSVGGGLRRFGGLRLGKREQTECIAKKILTVRCQIRAASAEDIALGEIVQMRIELRERILH